MNGIPPLVSPPSPKRTGWIVYSVIVTFFLFLSALGNLVLLAVAFGGGRAEVPLTRHRPQYEEQFVEGNAGARDKIAVIYLTGVISATQDGYTSDEGVVGDIKDQLRQAVEDKRVKAIILRINSPGGEVVASDSIYQAVAEAREKKPVVASMDSVAASGGYYVAVGSSYIMANELTITGSIGVILQTFTFGGLADKVGVKFHTFKSGRYKDLLNPAREPAEDEKALVQSLVQEVYEKFVTIVAEERRMNLSDLKGDKGLADGRILSGKQAREAGFVDDLGYFEDAIDKAMELAGIKEAKVVRYIPPFSLRNFFRLLGQSTAAKVHVEISPSKINLESGKLYFLPPYMFQ
jgi:protease-4